MNKYLFNNKLKFIGLIIFKAIYAAAFVGFALILQWIVNLITVDNPSVQKFLIGVGVATGYIFVFTIILLLKDKASTAFINKAVANLRDDLADSLLYQRYEEFVKNDSAKYISHLTNDVTTLSNNYFKSVMTLPEEIFTFIFAVAAAFYINYVVALVMLGLTLLIFIVPAVFNKPLNKANLKLSEAIKDYTSILKQTFLGIDVIKNFNSEEEMKRKIHTINLTLSKKSTLQDKLNLYAGDIGIFIVVLLQLGSIAISGYMYLAGVIMFGAVIAVVQLSSNMYSPLMQIANKIALISGIKDLSKVLNDISNNSKDEGLILNSFSQKISLKNLAFSYNPGEDHILKNVTLDFEKGKKYLIVGKSGSGKSTLLKLLSKTFSNYDGSIKIDGTDYNKYTDREILSKIAFSQQRSYLFDRSIRENIDFNGTDDQLLLEKAIKTSELSAFIEAQPSGLDEIINEEVNQISGGEKQRIGLARAIYKNSDILLLDEITSSLDKDTAYKVEKNILSLDNKTILNVSHKLHYDLLDSYDMICIVENGEVVSFCTPKEALDNHKLDSFIANE